MTVLAIPTMTRREQRRLLAEMTHFIDGCASYCAGEEPPRRRGRKPKFPSGPFTFIEKYKAPRGTGWCQHLHRTAAAARRCRE